MGKFEWGQMIDDDRQSWTASLSILVCLELRPHVVDSLPGTLQDLTRVIHLSENCLHSAPDHLPLLVRFVGSTLLQFFQILSQLRFCFYSSGLLLLLHPMSLQSPDRWQWSFHVWSAYQPSIIAPWKKASPHELNPLLLQASFHVFWELHCQSSKIRPAYTGQNMANTADASGKFGHTVVTEQRTVYIRYPDRTKYCSCASLESRQGIVQCTIP